MQSSRFLGYILRSSERVQFQVSLLAKTGNRKVDQLGQLQKWGSFYSGVKQTSLFAILLIIGMQGPNKVWISNTEYISERASQQTAERFEGIKCRWRHRLKTHEKVLVSFPFKELGDCWPRNEKLFVLSIDSVEGHYAWRKDIRAYITSSLSLCVYWIATR